MTKQTNAETDSVLLGDIKSELAIALLEKQRRVTDNRLQYFDLTDYPKQREFIRLTKENAQVLFMAGNRVGKSMTGAYMMACHLTGLYPDWWDGLRFDHPVSTWAAGETSETTRDIPQALLMGDPEFEEALGTGFIPKELILKTIRRPQIPNAMSGAIVLHKSGGYSKIGFKAYEQGMKKFMGEKKHCIWLDEEPPNSIFTQCITRTADSGGLVYMTFTPESGMTVVVGNFMNNLKPGQAIIQASWDDVPHLSEVVKKQLLEVYPQHERDMRSKGVPFFGSGRVFPYPEEHVICKPFDLPPEWPRLAGMDFGWEHPTAVVWCAYDRDKDTIYIYDCYKSKSKIPPSEHAVVIRARGDWIPISYPHDGNQVQDQNIGISKAKEYRSRHKLNMLPRHFENPNRLLGQDKTKRHALSVDVGINHMLQLIEARQLKVFSHLSDWFTEYRQYHRKEGRIVDMNDDLMSASRYSILAIHKAQTEAEAKSYMNINGSTHPYDTIDANTGNFRMTNENALRYDEII